MSDDFRYMFVVEGQDFEMLRISVCSIFETKDSANNDYHSYVYLRECLGGNGPSQRKRFALR